MPAWYDILGMDFDRRVDEAGVRRSAGQLADLIARERERGIPSERIVLAGFSQGAAMTLHVGLRHPERLAGLMVLSGYLVLGDSLEAEQSPANQDTPMFFGHGRQDDVVPVAGGEGAFQRVGADRRARWHPYDMGHELCAAELRDLTTWLHQVLK